ncbi:aminotransferase class I/II-fold pyridoxal phosphate-dependent enzyme [Marinilabilia sp.]|uniref:pyridoxal phosphate-dependent aminotransferase n=1 Tax=Marinilabilia sp. TaxID=2021252 RepID=UPI0025C57E81|nr:aminotransferase class I/II-fold pyridoxal phosphate-dependent enzyme [Marinilabilia sp.]
MITPAHRVSEVKEYYFSLKLKEIAGMIKDGKPVINLGIGNPDQPPAPEVLETLNKAALRPDTHGYQGYIGIPELRNAFSQWYKKFYGVILDPESEVLPLMGSKEGIMHISMAFLNPGDEVLVPNPGYPTYSAVTQIVGAKERSYDLLEENNWQPDLEALEKLDLSRVKMMWVNYPNMPTGAKASRTFFTALIAFAKRNDILICNDNPYSFILNEEPQSLLSIPGAKEVAIELNSLSKSHNMAGWRIGMAASNADFIKYILRIKSNMDSGMFRPMQEAAARALALEEKWYKEVNNVYKKRKELVLRIMSLLECTWQEDQVGMFIWARIPEKYPSSKDLSDKILYEANVFITPGFIFGDNGEKYIRISLCTSEEKLQESINRIENIITN